MLSSTSSLDVFGKHPFDKHLQTSRTAGDLIKKDDNFSPDSFLKDVRTLEYGRTTNSAYSRNRTGFIACMSMVCVYGAASYLPMIKMVLQDQGDINSIDHNGQSNAVSHSLNNFVSGRKKTFNPGPIKLQSPPIRTSDLSTGSTRSMWSTKSEITTPREIHLVVFETENARKEKSVLADGKKVWGQVSPDARLLNSVKRLEPALAEKGVYVHKIGEDTRFRGPSCQDCCRILTTMIGDRNGEKILARV